MQILPVSLTYYVKLDTNKRTLFLNSLFKSLYSPSIPLNIMAHEWRVQISNRAFTFRLILNISPNTGNSTSGHVVVHTTDLCFVFVFVLNHHGFYCIIITPSIHSLYIYTYIYIKCIKTFFQN